MWQGKKKAVTFSFDDGLMQDGRLMNIFDKYGLKGTFNLNSGLLGRDYSSTSTGKFVEAIKIPEHLVKRVYAGHEVAVHTSTHPRLTNLTDEEVLQQVREDKEKLSATVGYEVRGMAYPGGGVNHDDRVVSLVKQCGIAYARTTISSNHFDLPTDLLRFNPTVYYRDREDCYRLAEAFLETKTDKLQFYCLWGHGHEMDMEDDGWENIERICKLLSGREDIFYGTNAEVLLDE